MATSRELLSPKPSSRVSLRRAAEKASWQVSSKRSRVWSSTPPARISWRPSRATLISDINCASRSALDVADRSVGLT